MKGQAISPMWAFIGIVVGALIIYAFLKAADINILEPLRGIVKIIGVD